MKICVECGKEFDQADRLSATSLVANEDRVKYCSEKCARRAENRRAYQRRKSRASATRRAESVEGDVGAG